MTTEQLLLETIFDNKEYTVKYATLAVGKIGNIPCEVSSMFWCCPNFIVLSNYYRIPELQEKAKSITNILQHRFADIGLSCKFRSDYHFKDDCGAVFDVTPIERS